MRLIEPPDEFLPNMGSEEFLLCLSRQALEGSCAEASVQPRPKVRETRAALVEHFANEHFVHALGRFAPPADELGPRRRCDRYHWRGTSECGVGDGHDPAEEDHDDAVDGDPLDAVLPADEKNDHDIDKRAAA
ncbi:hypothetical protein [Ensifer sp. Root954]|uniref:hypothetical protein n=1 Tax=unclassified Ensifer TaxID=2633371 RepID=UPI0007159A1A|nr:hypothetical protein ASD49_29615 [Ensifer sp. Root1298]KQX85609.1 hypothetical protein ASD41_29480 [Ensifer sp. Root1312]KRC21495.1 hypothetical protein ASE29_30300 [Ensifer sp. Root74]KRD60840.1 hypothetical protein ASE71_32975 [Ensifer sp. Root954]